MNWQILHGDVRDKLAELPDGSVQTCVTSPPYWGLRDYGTGTWSGGDPLCAHSVGGQVQDNKAPGAITTGQRPGVDASKCRLCGAARADRQIGLERTPEAFCDQLVTVFREVRRVLANDGTCWVNLGDTYLAQQGHGFNGQKRLDHANRNVKVKRPEGVKPKDLMGIPWMVAFALRADGWYLRCDIIWHKPNPMPESCTDRPTKAHEYIFLLSKAARYYYDAGAIREPYAPSTLREFAEGYQGQATKNYAGTGAQNPSDVKRRIVQSAHMQHAPRNDGDRWRTSGDGVAARGFGANKRSVWTVATHPYPDAHFATYPPALIEPCILAGSRPGDTVLDPFCGSGTTGEVALKHGRNFIGIELNAEYLQLARKRLLVVAPLFSSEATA